MKVTFLSPVQHDAHSFAAGDSANLPDDSAALLVACGAVKELEERLEKSTTKSKPNVALKKQD